MKRLLCITALAVLALTAAALASDRYLFTLSSTNPTAATNNNTSQVIAVNSYVAVQCDAAAYVKPSAGGTAATTNDVKLAADQLYDIGLRSNELRVSVLAVSGTANCRVFGVLK